MIQITSHKFCYLSTLHGHILQFVFLFTSQHSVKALCTYVVYGWA